MTILQTIQDQLTKEKIPTELHSSLYHNNHKRYVATNNHKINEHLKIPNQELYIYIKNTAIIILKPTNNSRRTQIDLNDPNSIQELIKTLRHQISDLTNK